MPDRGRCKLVTFDVYTALFDIEGSLAPQVAAALGRDGDSLTVVRAWRRKQMEYTLISNSLQQQRRSFASITRAALDDTLARSHRDLPEGIRADLVRAWWTLRPWPEARAALEMVKSRGYTVALLSNGDHDMLQALLKELPPGVEHVFSSEQAGHYKPHPSVYALPLQALGLKPGDVLHVAGSATDVVGTKAAGLPCVWSNRNGEPVPLDVRYAPDHQIADLNGLLAIL